MDAMARILLDGVILGILGSLDTVPKWATPTTQLTSFCQGSAPTPRQGPQAPGPRSKL